MNQSEQIPRKAREKHASKIVIGFACAFRRLRESGVSSTNQSEDEGKQNERKREFNSPPDHSQLKTALQR